MRSMTGYGHSSIDSPLGHFDVTIKSLNHRFCSIMTHLPESFHSLDLKIQQLIKRYLSRGRIEYWLLWSPSDGLKRRPELDLAMAEAYLSGLKNLSERFNLEGAIGIGMIASLPGIFNYEGEPVGDTDGMWDPVSRATVEALQGLIEMREREGSATKASIEKSLEAVSEIGSTIEDLVPERNDRARRRLETRFKEVLQGKEIDDSRIMMEATILVDRWDISEELDRFKSHVLQCESTIKSEGSVGRRLHFLLQELQREVNTITSKAYDVEISHRAVEIKEIIEQIREQVENIE
jgi:uncharacterized protein (TIGR00255 family)